MNGEPQNPQAWRDLLTGRGLGVEQATQLAHLEYNEPVDLFLMEDLRNWAWRHYAGNGEAILARWRELGFTPAPGLPPEQRPRPTGIQTLRFLSQLEFATPAPTH
jgi:hypothetical protein